MDPRALWRFADQRGGPICKLGRSTAIFLLRFVESAQPRPDSYKSFQILPQTIPKPIRNRAKIHPKSIKIDPKSLQEASCRSSWGNALKKLDLERPKNDQEAPKSAQERPKSPSKPSKMESQTYPNPIFMRFDSLFFLTQNLYRFCIDFLSIFCNFLRSPNLENHAPVDAKRYFLQNRNCRT